MTFSPRSLRIRIVVLVGWLVLIAASLASLAALHPMQQQMRNLVSHQGMAVVASTAAALDHELNAKRILLRAVAQAAADLDRTDTNALQLLLDRYPVLHEQFDNVLIFDSTGRVVANQGDSRNIGSRSDSSDRFVREVIASREGGVSDAARSPLTGAPALLVAEPVIGANGSAALVIGGALSLINARFMAQFESALPGPTSYFYLIDRGGTIVYHPKASRILQNVFLEPGGVTEISRRAMAGFEGSTEAVTKEGKRAFISITHLRQSGWTLGLVQPVTEAFAPLQESEMVAWQWVCIVTLSAVALGLWLTVFLLRPLRRLQHHVDQLAAGDVQIDVLDSRRPDEIGSLSRAFYALSRQREQAEQQLALLSRTDTLTGLNNRRMFEAELPAALARARRHDRPMALAFFDVDHFKRINDTFGHATGDQVLYEFARRLRTSVREIDIVARLSGDEFVIIFELVDSATIVESLIAKLFHAIRQPFRCRSGQIAVTATAGIALGPGSIQDAELLRIADEALYEAKAAGRDSWALRQVGCQRRYAAGIDPSGAQHAAPCIE